MIDMGIDKLAKPQVVLFDYGGVLAEEGFTAGLKAIAVAHGLDPDHFFHRATEIIYACDYVIFFDEFNHMIQMNVKNIIVDGGYICE